MPGRTDRVADRAWSADIGGGELVHKTRRAPRENFVPAENRLRGAPRRSRALRGVYRGAPPLRRGRGQLLALTAVAALAGPPST